jgi:hypothetical protein
MLQKKSILRKLEYQNRTQVYRSPLSNHIKKAKIQTRCWSLLSKEEEKVTLKEKCRRLEVTSMEIFRNFGWNSKLRLQ